MSQNEDKSRKILQVTGPRSRSHSQSNVKIITMTQEDALRMTQGWKGAKTKQISAKPSPSSSNISDPRVFTYMDAAGNEKENTTQRIKCQREVSSGCIECDTAFKDQGPGSESMMCKGCSRQVCLECANISLEL